MQSFNIVTLCTSDKGKKEEFGNGFVPYRQGSSRLGRQMCQQSKARSKSAVFSSEFRPVSYSELRDNFPRIIKTKDLSQMNRKDSLVSPRITHEIKSAMLLIESRSKNELSKQIDQSSSNENREDQYIYKVHVNNQLSKSAKKTIEYRIQKNNQRWKSASTESHRNYKIPFTRDRLLGNYLTIPLADNNDETNIVDLCNNNTPEIEKEIPMMNQNEPVKDNALVTSISNSLTNFLTIDDIYGAKTEWTKNKFTQCLQTEEHEMKSPMKPEKLEKCAPLTNRDKRETVLRDYMNVYLNWRTAKSIQEHRDLLLGKSGRSRIRTATPKNRFQIFHTVLDEKQATIPKKKVLSKKENMRLNPNEKVKVGLTSKTSHNVAPIQSKNDFHHAITKQESIEMENKSKPKSDNGETSSDDTDEYSEIDWLQCEDI